ncbi:hypothetical protein [Bordetella bronchiseptica]|uniref:hypothetical protein n=1 Tax=Bordetella bronchiseptica TaxID=518 RepID=UPI001377873A|nr:hypothetical protein [Bordetella bronchiseptica]
MNELRKVKNTASTVARRDGAHAQCAWNASARRASRCFSYSLLPGASVTGKPADRRPRRPRGIAAPCGAMPRNAAQCRQLAAEGAAGNMTRLSEDCARAWETAVYNLGP